MQSKKYVNNSELPVFNIRKVNKKAIVIAKNIGEVNYFNPQADHFIDHEFQNFSSVHKVVDARKEKQMMLDQSVNQAIVNSKVYGDLKKIYLENKRKNAEHKKALEEQIERKKMQKIEALQQKQRLQNEKVKHMEAINAMKEKIYSIRQANERYRQSLNNRVSGETQYISNLIMSMRFQAEYEHGIDPDRMTYQELLELGDKIGVVSKGLPSQLIQTLPKTEVKEQSEQKCTVCFSNYEVGQIITKIFNCKHQFHFECLESWLGKQKVCPICKQEIEFGPAQS